MQYVNARAGRLLRVMCPRVLCNTVWCSAYITKLRPEATDQIPNPTLTKEDRPKRNGKVKVEMTVTLNNATA